MSLLLYINGQLMDLEPSQAIAQTRQVNDLNSLDDRQAGYTNKFKIPKTANNIRALEYLSITGNTSSVPYRKNECSLYSDTGECFVYKGWAIITDGGEDYEAVIYDGVIDLFKAIENTTLADLDLTLINHEKTVTAIRDSWLQEKMYRYIVADYNGNMNPQRIPLSPISLLQTDYLVPSVRVSFLWDKIMERYGFTYSGSIFQHTDFTNLWMTYPNGISSEENEVLLFDSNEWASQFGHSWPGLKYYPMIFGSSSINQLTLTNNMHLKVSETGSYRIEVEGTIMVDKSPGLAIYKNISHLINGPISSLSDKNPGTPLSVINSHWNSGEELSISRTIKLQAGDSICLIFNSVNGSVKFNDQTSLSVKVIKVNPGQIDFNTAFGDFSTTDFLKEIVHRFGLTLFKDKFKNHYEFLTLQEQLDTAPVVDWSSKFARKLNEAYVYSSYAQRNWFRYNYNNKESAHSDFFIDVPNENLPPARDVIKSKIYSPESEQSRLLMRLVNVYPLWQKEVVENPEEGEDPVTYKPLDNRFYLMRCTPVAEFIRLKSKALGQTSESAFYYAETFAGLPFSDSIPAYYSPIKKLLESSLIINVELYLKDIDITNFDFRKVYYIDRLSGYFLVNKINNYVSGKPVKCELVRVNYTPTSVVPVRDIETPRSLAVKAAARLNSTSVRIFSETNFAPQNNFIYQYSNDGITWRTASYTIESEAVNTISFPALSPPVRYIKMLYAADSLTSNIFDLNP